MNTSFATYLMWDCIEVKYAFSISNKKWILALFVWAFLLLLVWLFFLPLVLFLPLLMLSLEMKRKKNNNSNNKKWVLKRATFLKILIFFLHERCKILKMKKKISKHARIWSVIGRPHRKTKKHKKENAQ